jgi:hypothetical protein
MFLGSFEGVGEFDGVGFGAVLIGRGDRRIAGFWVGGWMGEGEGGLFGCVFGREGWMGGWVLWCGVVWCCWGEVRGGCWDVFAVRRPPREEEYSM